MGPLVRCQGAPRHLTQDKYCQTTVLLMPHFAAQCITIMPWIVASQTGPGWLEPHNSIGPDKQLRPVGSANVAECTQTWIPCTSCSGAQLDLWLSRLLRLSPAGRGGSRLNIEIDTVCKNDDNLFVHNFAAILSGSLATRYSDFQVFG